MYIYSSKVCISPSICIPSQDSHLVFRTYDHDHETLVYVSEFQYQSTSSIIITNSSTLAMAELTMADLKPGPGIYQSSREVFDVLIGEDAALPLLEALSSADNTTLRSMLSQPQWIKIALEEPHCIYFQDRPVDDNNHARPVMAMPLSTLARAIIIAARDGHAAAISTLLRFTLQQGIKPMSVILRWAVDRAIRNGHAAVFEAMISVEPKVVTFPLGHGNLPLVQAVKWRKTEVVAVLLQHGANPIPPKKVAIVDGHAVVYSGGYRSSLLSLAAMAEGPRMTELLLKHGVSVACSGALQSAANLGALDTMRLLMQHGADANELLPEDAVPHYRKVLYSSWTPMHFAASGGQVDAMKLLESNGARSDVKDVNGKTPAQLLEEYKP
ncbi:ankyrin [Acephala macrosclerotiorum]|nr:ankyrin [Acephala macrosclerotiorum]